MAVSRTFIRGINCSAFSNSVRRSGACCGTQAYSTAATPQQQAFTVDTSSRGSSASAGPSSLPIGKRALSTSAPARKADDSDPQRLRDIAFKQTQLERRIKGGEELTPGDEGQHKKRTLKSFSLEGKVCVVTGAARGIGNVIARGFIESGADAVAFIDLKKEDCERAISEMKDWYEDENGKGSSKSLDLMPFSCDIAKEQSVKSTFAELHKHYGRINCVVNSAGIVDNAAAEDYETSRLKKLMDINLDGAWFVATEAGRYMMQDQLKDASIILIASMSASIVNVPQLQSPYNISKAGVKHMAKCLGVEWARKGPVRCNSLSPGYTASKLTEAMFETIPNGQKLKADWESRIPMGYMGSPDQMKGAAIFLASDASSYVTATDLTVDGGYTAC